MRTIVTSNLLNTKAKLDDLSRARSISSIVGTDTCTKESADGSEVRLEPTLPPIHKRSIITADSLTIGSEVELEDVPFRGASFIGVADLFTNESGNRSKARSDLAPPPIPIRSILSSSRHLSVSSQITTNQATIQQERNAEASLGSFHL